MSGVTVQRDVRCDVAKMRKAQFMAWLKSTSVWHDTVDDGWWDGPQAAFTGAVDSGDVSHLICVMSGQQFQRALQMQNFHVDAMVHETLGNLAEGALHPGHPFSPPTNCIGELPLQSKLALVRHLLEVGAQVNSWSTVYWADEPDLDENEDACVWDTDLGVPVAAQPLYRAARGGDVEMVQLLLQYRADPEVQASDGSTALFAACQLVSMATCLLPIFSTALVSRQPQPIAWAPHHFSLQQQETNWRSLGSSTRAGLIYMHRDIISLSFMWTLSARAQ